MTEAQYKLAKDQEREKAVKADKKELIKPYLRMVKPH